jgi:hypothetical protein
MAEDDKAQAHQLWPIGVIWSKLKALSKAGSAVTLIWRILMRGHRTLCSLLDQRLQLVNPFASIFGVTATTAFRRHDDDDGIVVKGVSTTPDESRTDEGMLESQLRLRRPNVTNAGSAINTTRSVTIAPMHTRTPSRRVGGKPERRKSANPDATMSIDARMGRHMSASACAHASHTSCFLRRTWRARWPR